MLKLGEAPPFNRFFLVATDSNTPTWLQNIIDSFTNIFAALYTGILSVINGILHMIGAPFEGIAKVLQGLFEGITGSIRSAFGQTPLFVGILFIIIVGVIILYIYGQYQGFWHALQSPASALTGLGGATVVAAATRGGGGGGGGGGESIHTATSREAPTARAPPASRAPASKPKASRAKSTARKSKKVASNIV